MRRVLLLILAAAVLLLFGAGLALALHGGPQLSDQRATVSLGDQKLDSGVQGIPPQPTFSARLGAGRHASDYQAALDGRMVSLQDRGAGSAGLSLAAQPQASWHHLEIWRPGSGGRHDDTLGVDFRIVEPLQLAVGWLSGPDATRAEVTWSRQLADTTSLVARLQAAGATVTSDSSSAIATWSAPRAGQRLEFSVPAGFAASDGGFLAQAFSAGLTAGASASGIQLSDPPAVDVSGLRLQMYYVAGSAERQDLARHARQISVLSPAFYSVDGAGGVQSNVDAAALTIAQQAGVEVQPLVANQDFDAGVGHQLLSTPGLADQVTSQLVAQAKAHGYAGYQLDFENLAASDHDNLTAFSKSLAAGLQVAGLNYSVAVIPRRSTSSLGGPAAIYDYPSLTPSAAWLTMMAYDEHTRQEDPGPVAGLDWVKQVMAFSTTRLDPARVYLGVPLYSRDFSLAGAPVSRAYSDTLAVAAQSGGTLGWQFDTSSARAEYVAGGVQHVAWLDGRASLAAKLMVARDMHLAGVSAWRLGYEDPDFWSLWPSR